MERNETTAMCGVMKVPLLTHRVSVVHVFRSSLAWPKNYTAREGGKG